MIEKRKKEYPDAEVLIHPEAPAEVVALADYALSTGKILTHVRNSDKKEFIIATELGILHRLEKENPDKRFILISPEAVCPHMKLARLQDLLRALEEETEEIVLDREICERAVVPIRRMLEFKS
jgi:quinolinate synthase